MSLRSHAADAAALRILSDPQMPREPLPDARCDAENLDLDSLNRASAYLHALAMRVLRVAP
jgi:hypothetical protein